MPSPFPGMDPWLEAPGLWPDVHNSIAGEIRRLLNRTLPAGYRARLEERRELVAFDGNDERAFKTTPDVDVVEAETAGGVAVAGVRTTITTGVTVYADELPTLLDVGVYDDSDRPVTLVEILSPVNKRQNRAEFLHKRLNLLRSPAGLVEIDLLRRGRRVCGDSAGGPPVRVPVGTAYLALVSRPWERGPTPYPSDGFRWEAYFLNLADPLPVLPVPLRKDDGDAPLDLQHCFSEAYDGGSFVRETRFYNAPPDPPLPPAADEWANARIQAWRDAR